MSALLGGVAQGFIQGMDRRSAMEAAAAEKKAEREFRQSLTDKQIASQEKIAQLNITQRKNQHNQTLVSNGLAMLTNLKSRDKHIPSSKLPEPFRAALQSGVPTVMINGEPHFLNPNYEANQNKITDLIVQGILKGDLNPAEYKNNELVIKRLEEMSGSLKEGAKKPLNRKQVVTHYSRKWQQKQEKAKLAIIADLNKNNKGLRYFSVRPDEQSNSTVIAMPESGTAALRLTGLQPNTEIGKQIKDTNTQKYAYLSWLALKLHETKGLGDQAQYKAYKKEVLKYKSFLAQMHDNGYFDGVEFDNPSKPTTHTGFDQAFSDLFEIVGLSASKANRPSVEKAAVDSSSNSLRNEQEVNHAGETNNLQVKKARASDEIRGPETSAGGDQNNLQSPDTKVIHSKTVTVANNDSIKTTKTVDPDGVPFPRKSVTNQKGEKIYFPSNSSIMRNREFRDAIALDIHANINSEWFNTRMKRNPALLARYNQYKEVGLYSALSELASKPNPTGEDYERVRRLVKDNFDFNKEIFDEENIDEAIDMAIQAALEERIKYSAAEGANRTIHHPTGESTSSIRNVKIYDEDEELKGPKKTVAEQLVKEKGKIEKVKNQKNIFDQSMEQLGLIERALNSNSFLVREDGDGSYNNVNTLINIMTDPKLRGVLSNPEFLRRFGLPANTFTDIQESRRILQREGALQAGEAEQSVNVFLQSMEDIFKAVKKGGKVVGSGIADFLFGREAQASTIGKDITSENFKGSQIDGENDYKTRRLLKGLENAKVEQAALFQNRMAVLQGKLSAKNLTKQERRNLQLEVTKEFLKAKTAALKISLTYHFAGLVQGESGGRAISNEDFQIIFRALFGNGVSGPIMQGGAGVIADVLRHADMRNKIYTKYIRWGSGTKIAEKMLRIEKAKERSLYLRDPNVRKFLNMVEADTAFGSEGSKGRDQIRLTKTRPVTSAFNFPSRMFRSTDNNQKAAELLSPLLNDVYKNNNLDNLVDTRGNRVASYRDLNKDQQRKIFKAVSTSISAKVTNELNKTLFKEQTLPQDAFNLDKIEPTRTRTNKFLSGASRTVKMLNMLHKEGDPISVGTAFYLKALRKKVGPKARIKSDSYVENRIINDFVESMYNSRRIGTSGR